MTDGEREEGEDRGRERERSRLSSVKGGRKKKRERNHHTVKRAKTTMHPKPVHDTERKHQTPEKERTPAFIPTDSEVSLTVGGSVAQ